MYISPFEIHVNDIFFDPLKEKPKLIIYVLVTVIEPENYPYRGDPLETIFRRK